MLPWTQKLSVSSRIKLSMSDFVLITITSPLRSGALLQTQSPDHKPQPLVGCHIPSPALIDSAQLSFTATHYAIGDDAPIVGRFRVHAALHQEPVIAAFGS